MNTFRIITNTITNFWISVLIFSIKKIIVIKRKLWVSVDINDTAETPYKDNKTYFITSNELNELLEDFDKDYNDDTKERVKISSMFKKAGLKDV